ncbi:HupE/UreJ family protein [Pseudaminobacter sp. NGMCC 1.201702]|uniref:HupE/UreJ family protein n=1 Tax=Pseudaminobacter sp. NGMCC 1.201702 TaxID=3391825 RepID=UPI0039EFDA86
MVNTIRNTRNMMRLAAAVAVAYAASTMPSYAHILPEAGSFGAGLSHPLSGLDHVLAMAGVGIWAGQNADSQPLFRWLPLGFVIGMVAGSVFGMTGLSLPFVELGITGSVVLLGAIVALGSRVPFGAALAITAAFGSLHGFAHGQELPIASNAFLYGLGFVASTVVLHTAGFSLATIIARLSWRTALRVGGGSIAATGVSLAAGLAG